MPTPRLLVVLLLALPFALTSCDSSDPEPTTGTITGTISLPPGAGGDIDNTRVQLFETNDEFEDNTPTFTTTTDEDGNFTFENINPDSYFVSAWKDNNNSRTIDGGDFFGVIGTNQIEGFTPTRQQVVAGQNTGFDVTILALPPGFGISITGTYAGTGNGFSLTLTLTETNGTVTGSGNINVGQNVPLTVTGTFNAPNVNLTLSSTFDPINLTGTVSNDGTTINATLNGSGFSNDAVTLNLQ
jgi:uncharacterized protein (DUF2141 family)